MRFLLKKLCRRGELNNVRYCMIYGKTILQDSCSCGSETVSSDGAVFFSSVPMEDLERNSLSSFPNQVVLPESGHWSAPDLFVVLGKSYTIVKTKFRLLLTIAWWQDLCLHWPLPFWIVGLKILATSSLVSRSGNSWSWWLCHTSPRVSANHSMSTSSGI